MNRVFVTGYGLCCGNGLDTNEYWDNCSSLKTGLRVHEPWSHLDIKIVGLVPEERFTEKEKKEVEYFRARRTVFTRRALTEALEMAGVNPQDEEEVGVFLGVDFYSGDEYFLYGVINYYPQGKGEDRWEEFDLGYSISRFLKTGMKKDINTELLKSQTFFGYQPWIDRYIRSLIKKDGTSRIINNLCVSSVQSIGEAFQSIQNGDQDVVISGGLEEYSFVSGFTFSKLGVYVNAEDPSDSCTPFDARRKGTVLGEGAGILILESEEHMKKRGATPIAEILGYSTTNNVYHVTNSPTQGEGLAQSMEEALEDSGLSESDIDVVVAHGTGTYVNDSSECNAINTVLPSKPLVHSMKSYVGHTLSAAGVINVITGLLEMKHNFVLPTLFLKKPGKNCDVNHVKPEGEEKEVNAFLTNAAGFGGFNGTLVVKKADE